MVSLVPLPPNLRALCRGWELTAFENVNLPVPETWSGLRAQFAWQTPRTMILWSGYKTSLSFSRLPVPRRFTQLTPPVRVRPICTMPSAGNVPSEWRLEGQLVLAACGSGCNRGIGMNGDLPWPKLVADMRHFSRLTKGGTVVMGRATFDSLPENVRPLPGRLNVVLSSKPRRELELPDEVLLAGSLDAAETMLRARAPTSPVYVIGGADVFRAAMKQPRWSTRIHYTEVQTEFACDRVFEYDIDAPSSGFSLVSVSDVQESNGIRFVFKEYVRCDDGAGASGTPPAKTITKLPGSLSTGDSPPRANDAKVSPRHEEHQYLDLIRRILATGVSRGDRTGTGTMSVFGETMRFDLRSAFPLLTTKRVFWRGVAEELLWFIRGSTNANELAEKGVHIWDGNGSREFLDGRGFPDRQVGDLGPVYGFQWRHFGAEYSDMHADYTGQGFDQLKEIIETIKTNPNDRRMVLSAWNPAALHQMALPPCHMMAQFYVANDELSCLMYQRSCDMGLGVPFNIASYSLLTRLIAHVTGLRAGDFVHVLGDAHVYNNHIDALREQIEREPRPFPTLTIRNRPDLNTIDDFVMEDLELNGYDPHKTIKMQMAV